MSAAEVTTLLRCTNAFVQRNNVVTSAAWRPLVANVVQSSDLSSCRGVRDELSLTTRHDDRSLDCTTFAARGRYARHHVTRHSAATSPAPNSRASCPAYCRRPDGNRNAGNPARMRTDVTGILREFPRGDGFFLCVNSAGRTLWKSCRR